MGKILLLRKEDSASTIGCRIGWYKFYKFTVDRFFYEGASFVRGVGIFGLGSLAGEWSKGVLFDKAVVLLYSYWLNHSLITFDFIVLLRRRIEAEYFCPDPSS